MQRQAVTFSYMEQVWLSISNFQVLEPKTQHPSNNAPSHRHLRRRRYCIHLDSGWLRPHIEQHTPCCMSSACPWRTKTPQAACMNICFPSLLFLFHCPLYISWIVLAGGRMFLVQLQKSTWSARAFIHVRSHDHSTLDYKASRCLANACSRGCTHAATSCSLLLPTSRH